MSFDYTKIQSSSSSGFGSAGFEASAARSATPPSAGLGEGSVSGVFVVVVLAGGNRRTKGEGKVVKFMGGIR